MQFQPSNLLGLNELVELAYVQNLGVLMKRPQSPNRSLVETVVYTVILAPLLCDIFLQVNCGGGGGDGKGLVKI